MRPNVVLDEALVERAKQLTGIKTTRGVIHEALRSLVRLREQGEIRALRGQLRWKGTCLRCANRVRIGTLRHLQMRTGEATASDPGGFDSLDRLFQRRHDRRSRLPALDTSEASHPRGRHYLV